MNAITEKRLLTTTSTSYQMMSRAPVCVRGDNNTMAVECMRAPACVWIVNFYIKTDNTLLPMHKIHARLHTGRPGQHSQLSIRQSFLFFIMCADFCFMIWDLCKLICARTMMWWYMHVMFAVAGSGERARAHCPCHSVSLVFGVCWTRPCTIHTVEWGINKNALKRKAATYSGVRQSATEYLIKRIL